MEKLLIVVLLVDAVVTSFDLYLRHKGSSLISSLQTRVNSLETKIYADAKSVASKVEADIKKL